MTDEGKEYEAQHEQMRSVMQNMYQVLPGVRGPMPAKIAAAVLKVMREVGSLGFDERNPHGGYDYTSIDRFLTAVRPLCTEAGLIIVLDEIACEIRERHTLLTYAIWLTHESGETWGPVNRRVFMPITGPQAFGAAASYVLKQFMRHQFQIPTGERDADETAPERPQKPAPDSPRVGKLDTLSSALAPHHEVTLGSAIEVPLLSRGKNRDWREYANRLATAITNTPASAELKQFMLDNRDNIDAFKKASPTLAEEVKALYDSRMRLLNKNANND